MIAIEKPEGAVIRPEDALESYTVPATTWAIFECHGKLPEAIVASEMYAFGEWLPSSGYVHALAPEMEVYPPRDGYCEFWLPIRKKGGTRMNIPTCQVAVVQTAPVLFNREATIQKVGRLTAEAAASGAQLILFPEALVPGLSARAELWRDHRWAAPRPGGSSSSVTGRTRWRCPAQPPRPWARRRAQPTPIFASA